MFDLSQNYAKKSHNYESWNYVNFQIMMKYIHFNLVCHNFDVLSHNYAYVKYGVLSLF